MKSCRDVNPLNIAMFEGYLDFESNAFITSPWMALPCMCLPALLNGALFYRFLH